MSKKRIDLSDIKQNDLDKTSTFSDLMTRSERKKRTKENYTENTIKENNNDIIDMLEERKRNTKDLTIELEKTKEEYNKIRNKEEELSKTQTLELTREMKYNFNDLYKETKVTKKSSTILLNISGVFTLLCVGYYIYFLIFSNYENIESYYLILSGVTILSVLLFGFSSVTNKKSSKCFSILNILSIIGFIVFNAYIILN